jgi:hypothetical protein
MTADKVWRGRPAWPCRRSLVLAGVARPRITTKAGRRAIPVCPMSIESSPVRSAAYAEALDWDSSVKQAGDFKAMVRVSSLDRETGGGAVTICEGNRGDGHPVPGRMLSVA